MLIMSFRWSGLFGLLMILAGATSLQAQVPQVRNGIDLYNRGDLTNAVQALKGTNDLVALYYLGQSYMGLKKDKDARQSFDRLLKEGYRYFESEIRLHRFSAEPGSADRSVLSDFLKSKTSLLAVTAAGAHRSLGLKGLVSKDNEWKMKAEFITELQNLVEGNEFAHSFDELSADAKIQSKPRPRYTDSARTGNVQGTVELLVILRHDGIVAAAAPIKMLPDGLTEQSYLAARKIAFTPASKNGRPVTTLKHITYTFSIY